MNTLFTTLSMIAAANPAGFTYNVEQNEMQATGYAVALAASQNSFGFTFNVESNSMQTSGFAVALACTQDSHGIDGLESVINIVMNGTSGATCVGGWLDQNTGLYYYDATVIIDDREAAISFGRMHGQFAIFDLNNMKEIRL